MFPNTGIFILYFLAFFLQQWQDDYSMFKTVFAYLLTGLEQYQNGKYVNSWTINWACAVYWRINMNTAFVFFHLQDKRSSDLSGTRTPGQLSPAHERGEERSEPVTYCTLQEKVSESMSTLSLSLFTKATIIWENQEHWVHFRHSVVGLK